MNIFVGTETGFKIKIKVKPSDTIDNIKSKIMHNIHIQYGEIELFLAFKRLDNDRTLADYNISQGQTLTLVICPNFNDVKKIRKKYDKEMLIEERKKIHDFIKNYDLQKKNEELKN